jgi:ActR/RegA family two-component response regulator
MKSLGEVINESLDPIDNPRPLREAMYRYIYRALKGMNWNVSRTARRLDIPARTLRNYVFQMRKAGINIPLHRGGAKDRMKMLDKI